MGGRKIILMSENINNNVVLEEEESSFDFKQLWLLFVLNWHWFILSIIACLLIAGLYLWFTPSTVIVSAKMQLIDKSKQSGSMSAGMAMLNNLPFGIGSSFGGGATAGVDFEKELLKTNTLVCDVVKELNLNTEYRLSNWGKRILLYRNNPVSVTLDEAHLQWFDSELPITYHQIDLSISKNKSGYKVKTILKENKNEFELSEQLFTTLPATIKTNFGTLYISDNHLPEKQAKAFINDYSLYVTIIPRVTSANAFIGKMVDEGKKKGGSLNMITISILDESLLRGIDFINQLVSVYNQRANNEKNEEARKTDEFVNARLAKIDQELGSSDAAWENSKKNFKITSPEVDAAEVVQKKSVYETQLVSIGTELQLHDYLSEYVNDPANLFEVIPAAISSGVGSDGTGGSAGTASLLAQHNNLVNQRKDLLKSISEKSPQIQRLDQTIQELHPTIVTSLKRDRQAIVMRQNTLQREYGKYIGRVSTAPEMERVLTEIGRQREIKQGVFLLMLQKREETAMELANTTDKGKLIDPPTEVQGSAKPPKKLVLLISFVLGTILPMGFLYLFQLLKTKIDSNLELESNTRFPVIAEIPIHDNGDAIRNLRTNLLLNLKENQKTILIASNAEGDGKSFIAQHLADSLNAIGKKTLYLNTDLRDNNCPLGQRTLATNGTQESSIVNYQFGKGHPADILASESFAKEVAKAKAENDYVIFDSPAMSQYADAYQLATFADTTLFVVKSGVTDKSVIESLNGDAKLPNIILALNAIDTTTKKYKLNKKN